MPFKKGQGRIVKGMRLSIGESSKIAARHLIPRANANTSLSGTPTRRGRDDVSDEEMADADGDDDMGETGEETPAQDDIGDDAATPAAEEEEEDEGGGCAASDHNSSASTRQTAGQWECCEAACATDA